MSEKEPQAAYFRNERVDLTTEPPRPGPAAGGLSMKDAEDLVQAQRRGESVGGDREPPRRPEDDALQDLRAEKHAAEQQQRDAEAEQRQDEADRAELAVTRAAAWHPDDAQTLSQLQQEASEFESAKSQLAQAQRFAKENPGQLSAQQRADLQEANQRLLQRQSELQAAGAQVQQASQVKNAEAARRKLYAEFPELADSDTRDRLVAWAQKQGIPREVTLSETRPEVVGAALKKMQAEEKEKRQKHLDRPRKPVSGRGGAATRHITLDEARGRLRSGGDINDALNVITFEKERENEAQS